MWCRYKFLDSLYKCELKKLNKCRHFSYVSPILCSKNQPTNKQVVIRDSFADIKDKNKETYLAMVKIFEDRDIHRRGHVEFIQNALKHMETFGVDKDLEVYKSLINVLPKGKFIPQNIFQAEFMHYPKQQQVAINVLDQMEENGVIPDEELELILLNIFGSRGHPVRKYMRMLYWMPKFKNLSPWAIPNPVPNDALELAKLALERMSSVDLQSVVKVYQSNDIADSIEDTWIVSAQSPKQKQLLAKHPIDSPVYVEGPFMLWLRNQSVNYFILRAEPGAKRTYNEPDPDDVSNLDVPIYEKPKRVIEPPSVHEQDDGIILGMCATGSSSKDSLLSWIRSLQQDGNPALAQVPVLFTLKQPGKDLIILDTKTKNTEVDKPL